MKVNALLFPGKVCIFGGSGTQGGVGGSQGGLGSKTYLTETKFLTGICKLDEEISWTYCVAFTEFTLGKLTSTTSRAALKPEYNVNHTCDVTFSRSCV